MKPVRQRLQEKDCEIEVFKQTIEDQKYKLDDLEQQHGRRDSLQVAGIPENPDCDSTDAAMLKVCHLMKWNLPWNQKISLCHIGWGEKSMGKTGKVLSSLRLEMSGNGFSVQNRHGRVRLNNSDDDNDNNDNDDNANNCPKIYINKDLTQHRASLAHVWGTVLQKGWAHHWHMDHLWQHYGERPLQPCVSDNQNFWLV